MSGQTNSIKADVRMASSSTRESESKKGLAVKKRKGKARRQQELSKRGINGHASDSWQSFGDVGNVVTSFEGRRKGGETDGKKRGRREKQQLATLEKRLWCSFDKVSVGNPLFSAYYRQLLVNWDESDWNKFVKCLATDLPVTIRLNRGQFQATSCLLAERLKKMNATLSRFASVYGPLRTHGLIVENSWLKDVYQLNLDRQSLSKTKSFEMLHSMLEKETRLGHISRQGIASMIPAIVLNPAPHEHILDICAAPGSKTEQLLQMLGNKSTGCVLANDADPERLDSLIRRIGKEQHPNLIVSCSRGEDLCAALGPEKFDCIVCDVPCSGDGTIRQSPHLWRRWSPRNGVRMHPIQLQLAKSAATLLKVGGRMVYATCSMNPIEDEAVVSSLLEASDGALRLRRVNLQGFVARPGLQTWCCDEKVLNGDMNCFNVSGTTNNETKPIKHKSRNKNSSFDVSVSITMKPPSRSKAESQNLERCLRVLPHENNTEGFFVALIEKVRPWNYDHREAISSENAKEVLKKVGFNPRTMKDRLKETSEQNHNSTLSYELFSRLPMDMRSYLETSLGLPRSLISDSEILFRNNNDKGYSFYIVSKTVSHLVNAEDLALKGVSLLSAGVRFAESTAQGNSDTVLPTPSGILKYANILFDKSPRKINVLGAKEMLVFLKLLEEEIQAENGDQNYESRSNTNIRFSTTALMDSMKDRLLGDAAGQNDSPSQFLSKSKLAQAIVTRTTGGCFFAGLNSDSLVELIRGGYVAMNGEGKRTRMSVAERRRCKKAKKCTGSSSVAASTSATDSKFDMYSRSSTDHAPLCVAVAIFKESDEHLTVVFQPDLVESFVEGLEGFISL